MQPTVIRTITTETTQESIAQEVPIFIAGGPIQVRFRYRIKGPSRDLKKLAAASTLTRLIEPMLASSPAEVRQQLVEAITLLTADLPPTQQVTECQITRPGRLEEPLPEVLARGEAAQHPDDLRVAHAKHVGRHLAFQRAVEQFDRPDRAQLYEWYWRSMKQPPPGVVAHVLNTPPRYE